ncbi:hypothetical protein OSB04_027893 [Centaurea solstitialis]|uniref:Ubiquitin-like protease family profile domain-containing protein n=1 Tax=Centaurea solstitialis TaxID=347529 RepID=A0AA38VX53_9ASTR|nr:hypothetical protein OSB04_027893 [Centaurea solstitialis]
MDIINLRNIDMLFFLFLRRCHYYFVVFNLKTHVIDILDNMERVGHIIDVYDFDIHIMREMVVQHLRNIGHPSADLMEPVEDRIMEIKWRTRNNYTDCGVFCMRHMETYMGGGSRGWYTGFTTEEPSQKKQIENLRIKYCTKILLSDQNICKKLVEEEVAQFYSLSPTAQLKKKTHADVTRKYRLNSERRHECWIVWRINTIAFS